MGVRDRRLPADSPVYIRGEPDAARRGRPARARRRCCGRRPARRSPRGSGPAGAGRVARVDQDNPLTARVMVNRVWLHLFGRGLVPTPDNFGASRPAADATRSCSTTWPCTFMDDGWSVKKLIRRLVLSRAYQLGVRRTTRRATRPTRTTRWSGG